MYKSILDQEILFLKGVGPNKAELLEKELKIKFVRDLLYDVPIRYIDRTTFHKIKDIRSGAETVQLVGTIRNLTVVGTGRRKRLIATFHDETGKIDLIWFKGIKWIKEIIKPGMPYILFGKTSIFGRKLNIAHPDLELAYNKKENPQHFEPVYRSTEKLNSSYLDSKGRIRIIKPLIAHLNAHEIIDMIPDYIRRKLQLPSLGEALKNIHFPVDRPSLNAAIKRMKFEELFLSQMGIVKHYLNNKTYNQGFIFSNIGDRFNRFFSQNLTFQLTEAQKRVLKEIRQDLKTGKQMNRLLQGDVGSGKTIVALMTMLMALDNGFQACLMAPTEILAQQHFQSIKTLLKGLSIRVAILTGSIKGVARKNTLKLLQLGEINILVGTHAIIEEKVNFHQLGIAIIDEQHRFGVAQRARIWEKGKQSPPHILVMTATPIPRTLHMTIYGDLDVSIIDELPPGRKPVITEHRTEYHRPKIIKFMKKMIEQGKQIYIVYPLIEESSKLDLEDLNNGYERLLVDFPKPKYQISVIHGRMNAREKEFEMQRFIEGKTHIMVATTVIEVGVDVPNATVMVIENSERFGLSQLHQLRGRVGRGGDQSYCILMSGIKITEDAKKRLSTMVSTNDGFKVAEVDLLLRGPGTVDGTQQSGLPIFKIADIVQDSVLLKTAREIAQRILDKDPDLLMKEHLELKTHLLKHKNQEFTWSQIS